MQAAPQLSLSPSANDWDQLGVYHLLCGNQELAQKAFAKSFAMAGNPWSAVHWALLADEAGDPESRDKALAGAIDRGPKYLVQGGPPTSMIEFAKWLNNAYHKPADAPPNTDALNEVIKSTNVDNQANLNYFASRYLQDHGQPELALEYLKKSVAQRVQKWNYTLACARLRDMQANQQVPAADARTN
jgi:hypothetical protein